MGGDNDSQYGRSTDRISRRRMLAALSATSALGVAGCSGGGSGGDGSGGGSGGDGSGSDGSGGDGSGSDGSGGNGSGNGGSGGDGSGSDGSGGDGSGNGGSDGGSGGGKFSRPSDVSSKCQQLDGSFVPYDVAGTNLVFAFDYPDPFKAESQYYGQGTSIRVQYEMGEVNQFFSVTQEKRPYNDPLYGANEKVTTLQFAGEDCKVTFSGVPSGDGGSTTFNTYLPHEMSSGKKYLATTVSVNLVGPCDDLMLHLGKRIVESFEPNPDTTYTKPSNR